MTSSYKQQNFFLKFTLCLLVCVGGGWLTGLVTKPAMLAWYPKLIKPTGTPPNLIFPIVWSILYVCMAISLTLLWTSPSKNKGKALFFFTVQLLLNFIWSWLFFVQQQPGAALVDIILLWIFILLTIKTVHEHSKTASYLLIPYLLWVTYAIYLNFFIWLYN